jgi:iron complex transport system substrate-binding protein
MTLNDTHMVSQAIKLCGGINIFGHLKPLVPTVSREAVVNADPDMIITSSEKRRETESWRALNTMKAVQQNNLFTLDSRVLNRAGPRLVDATRTLCETIAQARKNLRTRQ